MDPFYLALLLYVAALVLAFVDLFVPSGGLLIILASLTALACVLFGFRSSYGMGLVMLAVVLASVPAFAVLAIKIWPLTPIGRRIILHTPTRASRELESGEESVKDPLIGAVLLAETPLLPTGHIKVGHKRYNAISRSGVIEAGQHVKVLAVHERNYLVQPTNEPCTDLRASVASPAAAEPREYSQEELLDLPADELGLESLEGPDEPRH